MVPIRIAPKTMGILFPDVSVRHPPEGSPPISLRTVPQASRPRERSARYPHSYFIPLMKFLNRILAASSLALLCLTGNVSAQTTGSGNQSTSADYVEMRDGKMMMYGDNKWSDMKSPMTLRNGYTVTGDGVVTNKEGKKIKLVANQRVSLDGKLMVQKDGQSVDQEWNFK